MLPHVHHKHGIEARHVARLMKRDPVIGKPPISWILIRDGPTNVAHFANAHKIRLPDIVTGYIKCMALVESHPIAYQMEEFIYYLRDHIVGLNPGRWDYMASLIHFNLADTEWILPDRNTIPHNVPFFQNRALRRCAGRDDRLSGGATGPGRTEGDLSQRVGRLPPTPTWSDRCIPIRVCIRRTAFLT